VASQPTAPRPTSADRLDRRFAAYRCGRTIVGDPNTREDVTQAHRATFPSTVVRPDAAESYTPLTAAGFAQSAREPARQRPDRLFAVVGTASASRIKRSPISGVVGHAVASVPRTTSWSAVLAELLRPHPAFDLQAAEQMFCTQGASPQQTAPTQVPPASTQASVGLEDPARGAARLPPVHRES
jgi:hypothetical protein